MAVLVAALGEKTMNRLARPLAVTFLVFGVACGGSIANKTAGGSGTGGGAGRGSGGSSASGGALGTGGNTNGAGGNLASTGGNSSGTGGATESSGGVVGTGGNANGSGGTAGASGSGGVPTGGTDAAGNSGGSNANGSGGATDGGSANGTGGSKGPNCTLCHGDEATGNPAPPTDTDGNTEPTAARVGAHAKHLASSTWHRGGVCKDCHTLPTTMGHSDGTVDFAWGSPSNADNAKPAVNLTDPDAPTCSGTYCHGTTLAGAGAAKTTPVWNQVGGDFGACGTACHLTPPPASSGHPASTACETCHGEVISAFKAGNPPTVTWKDASLHVNGKVEVDALTCTSCHGTGTNPVPPKDTEGNTATSAPGVGAHAQHLASASWHRKGECADCHATPTSNAHANGKVDFTWGAPSNASGASPNFDTSSLACSGTYCHGAKMTDTSANIGRAPIWNKVDGTQDACGKSCHANPPTSGSHSASNTACQNCHGEVIGSYNGANSTWKNASLHINGKVEVAAMTCDSCHGNPPNAGTHTRRQHKVACSNCHPDTNGPTHRNGTVNVTCGSGQGGCHGND
jgi:predicted CxxxxCH...CXXCH cytochrome family protein